MKDIFLRFWNTIKIPLIAFIILVLGSVFKALVTSGDFSLVFSWEYWKVEIYALAIMCIPATTGALDKWLRGNGIYIEQIFNGFRKPEAK